MYKHTGEYPTHKSHHFENDNKPISAHEFFQNAFGDRPEWAVHLRGFRIRESLTQLALAKELGVRQSQISEMETGKRSIGKAFANRLADFFHTSYKSFL